MVKYSWGVWDILGSTFGAMSCFHHTENWCMEITMEEDGWKLTSKIPRQNWDSLHEVTGIGTECNLSGWLMQWLNPGLSGGFPGGWLTLVALWPWESLCTQIPAHAVDRQGTLYVPKQAWLTCHTRFPTDVLEVPREVTHLSLSSLPVALEQFTLAVRHCPDREDQALLMKVGYQISPYFLKASLHSDCPEESSVFLVRE